MGESTRVLNDTTNDELPSGHDAVANEADRKADKARRKQEKKARKEAARLARMEAAQRAIADSPYTNARQSDVAPDRVYVADSPTHGLGMFAATRIKKNTVLGRLEGMLTYDDGTYVLWITKKLGFELTNDFRFINHDKRDNCELSDVDVITTRSIEPHEELMHDYGW